jgi:hypothetical protein
MYWLTVKPVTSWDMSSEAKIIRLEEFKYFERKNSTLYKRFY